MASKVSFRARALDVHKLMPVFGADELPDLAEYAAINRQVASMPTGMEKDEELVSMHPPRTHHARHLYRSTHPTRGGRTCARTLAADRSLYSSERANTRAAPIDCTINKCIWQVITCTDVHSLPTVG